MSLKQSLLGLTKKCCKIIKIANFTLDNCTHHFKSTLTSTSPANFRLDIFHFKTLLYSFWGRKNALKADKIYILFSRLNICYIASEKQKIFI